MRIHLISRLRSRTRSKGRFVKCTSPPSPLLRGLRGTMEFILDIGTSHCWHHNNSFLCG